VKKSGKTTTLESIDSLKKKKLSILYCKPKSRKKLTKYTNY